MLHVAEVLLRRGQHGADYDGGLFGRALRHHQLGKKHSWLWLSHDVRLISDMGVALVFPPSSSSPALFGKSTSTTVPVLFLKLLRSFCVSLISVHMYTVTVYIKKN